MLRVYIYDIPQTHPQTRETQSLADTMLRVYIYDIPQTHPQTRETQSLADTMLRCASVQQIAARDTLCEFVTLH